MLRAMHPPRYAILLPNGKRRARSVKKSTARTIAETLTGRECFGSDISLMGGIERYSAAVPITPNRSDEIRLMRPSKLGFSEK